jgi:lipopolysaccharide export system ATP-binding protein
MTVLSATGLRKSYRGGRGVDGVALELREGEVVGLLGPNGAGKTTTFRLLIGDVRPDAGTVSICGRDVTRRPLRARVRDGGLGYLAQEPSVFENLSVADNLLTILHGRGVDAATRGRLCREMLERVQISHLRNTLAKNLSGGQKRRLEFARCLLCEPRAILLDEPFNGIDPIAVEDIQDMIRGLRAGGISFLITDHHVVETLTLADRAYVIHQGRVLFEGPPQAVVDDPKVRECYLGEDLRLPGQQQQQQQRQAA